MDSNRCWRAASSPPCRSCLITECPAVYHVFSFRFHKSKPIDLLKNPNLVNAAILAVYADIWPAVYINELMAIPPCHASPILRPNIELIGTQLVLRWLPMLCLGTPLSKEINV